MRIAAIEPMKVVEEDESFDFHLELDAINEEQQEVSPVENSAAEESLEAALGEPQENAAARLSDFIQSYKTKLNKKDMSQINPLFRKALLAYNYLDNKENEETQLANHLKKAA